MARFLPLLLMVSFGCNLFGNLMDGGILPGGDGISDLEFNALVGDPAPILQGGETTFAGMKFTTTIVGDTRTIVVGDSDPALLKIVYQGQTVQARGDTDGDGQIDYQYDSTNDGSAVHTTTLTDLHASGVFDQQEQETFDISNNFPFTVTDTLSTLAAGAWVQSWTYTGVASANQGAGCLGTDGFPENPAGSSIAIANTQISIVTNGSPGACSQAQGIQIEKALRAAIADIALCLATSNPVLGARMKVAISSQPLQISCGNTCAGVLATTDLPSGEVSDPHTWTFGFRKATFQTQRMNLNPDVTLTNGHGGAARSVVEIEEVLIHELIHFAGDNHKPPPDGDPAGHDMVYGCGRYCTRCRSGEMTYDGHNTAAAFAWDCADCSAPAVRAACGVQTLIEPNGTCTCDDCKDCHKVTPYSCDKKLVIEGAKVDGCCALGGPNCGSDALCIDGFTDMTKGLAPACLRYSIGWCTSGPP